jgi:hypothetical protein
MGESSAGDFTVGKIQKTSAAASCKNVRSTEKEYHSHIINSLRTGSLCRCAPDQRDELAPFHSFNHLVGEREHLGIP